ncbi:MAG: hypothetical protein BGN96_09560 [Bacteroidales bacterium 45-6]|nr:MAG: hypothetical protein BGN96_09560 [Bacteroidales bacterium 45-6]
MRLIINYISLALVIVAGSISCRSKSVSEKLSLSETDKYYSTISEKKGRNAAFVAMFDSSAVMLVGKSMPVEGIRHISEYLGRSSDSAYILTWMPLREFQSKSADLGYTYGTYLVRSKVSGDTLELGTYTTIWKKDKRGSWKAVLDTGNEGLK